MDVPAPVAGVVRQLRVSIGDRVSEGSVLLTMDAEQDAAVASGEDARLRRRPAPGGPGAARGPGTGPPRHRPRRAPTAKSTTPRSS